MDENNLCRVIDAFVNALDFGGLGFKYSQPRIRVARLSTLRI